jgi:hypothetical protein
MRLGDVFGIGAGLAAGLLDCAWRVVRDVSAPLATPLARLVQGDGHIPRPAPADSRPGGPQERIEDAKFFTGHTAAPPAAVDREAGTLPRAYGFDRAVLVPRDPWWLFAYWEITPLTRVTALRALGEEAEGASEMLRLHADADGGPVVVDVALPSGTERWHLEAGRPATRFRVEVGLRTRSGRFVPLVASGVVDTPPAGPSADTTVRWLDVDRDGAPVSVPPSALVVAPLLIVAPLTDAARSSDVHAPRG